jgi:hypothetical protein
MILLLAAALQTVPAQRPETIDFTIHQPCERKTNEEVVVCAKRGDSPYRLKESAAPTHKPAKAEMQIADGVTAGADSESADVGGFPSNRFMLRLKMKF